MQIFHNQLHCVGLFTCSAVWKGKGHSTQVAFHVLPPHQLQNNFLPPHQLQNHFPSSGRSQQLCPHGHAGVGHRAELTCTAVGTPWALCHINTSFLVSHGCEGRKQKKKKQVPLCTHSRVMRRQTCERPRDSWNLRRDFVLQKGWQLWQGGTGKHRELQRQQATSQRGSVSFTLMAIISLAF